MGTTTEVLSCVHGRPLMAPCGVYECDRKAVPIPWPASCRRHSTSLSFFEEPLSPTSSNDTGSLPSSPPLINCMLRQEDKKDYIGRVLSSSSASSGYYSEYLSDSGFTPDSPIFPPSDSKCDSTIRLNRLSLSEKALATSQTDHDDSDEGFASLFADTFDLPSSPMALPDSVISLSPPACDEETSSSPSSNHSTPPSSTSSSQLDKNGFVSVSVFSKGHSNSETRLSVEESPRQRVKDDEGFIRRAACVCVNEDESKVVLISSKCKDGGWLVPGGGLERGEAEVEAAVREAWEEAGIVGSVKRFLGVFQSVDETSHKKKRTAVYVLAVGEQHSVFPEASLGRSREWFSIDGAVGQLSQCKPHQIAYLRAL